MSHSLILECHWSFEQVSQMVMSDVVDFLKSSEFSQHQKAKSEQFKVLLKTIAAVAGGR